MEHPYSVQMAPSHLSLATPIKLKHAKCLISSFVTVIVFSVGNYIIIYFLLMVYYFIFDKIKEGINEIKYELIACIC